MGDVCSSKSRRRKGVGILGPPSTWYSSKHIHILFSSLKKRTSGFCIVKSRYSRLLTATDLMSTRSSDIMYLVLEIQVWSNMRRGQSYTRSSSLPNSSPVVSMMVHRFTVRHTPVQVLSTLVIFVLLLLYR
jgi:hypothetical protein